jgi:UDP-glucose 4-epimerase
MRIGVALQRLWGGGDSTAYNLGNGNGFSVREVIDAARAVTGRDIPVQYGERRFWRSGAAWWPIRGGRGPN